MLMIAAIIQALAGLYVFYASVLALNRMDSQTSHAMRLAHVALAAGSAAMIVSCFVARDIFECLSAVGMALYVEGNRRERKNMTNLSEHFTLEEMTASQTAVRKGIDNTPSASVVENLRRVAGTLEQIRALVGAPVHVSSGYRSPELNAAVGGARDSAHLQGLAADIEVPGMTPQELAKAIEGAGIQFDQLIYEGTWVHVGLAAGPLRGQVLTATFNGGRATYTEGIA